MKIRNGFVSNSSSSSFVCNVCGEHFEGMDLCPSDVDCTYCVNGHIICNEHIIDPVDGSDAEFDHGEDGEGFYSNHEIKEECCPICRFDTYSDEEMANYLEKTRKINRDEVFAAIKAINKRRKKLYDEEYVSHVCKEFNLTDELLLAELKEKFGKYSEFIKFMRAKNENT